MKDILEVKNLTIKYNKAILKDISFSIKENTFVTLSGKSGVGKTSLAKAILGYIPYEGEIKVNESKIELVEENPNNNIIGDLVEEELRIVLKNLKYSKKDQNDQIEKIISDLKIESIKSKLTTHLSGGEKQIVSFIKTILKKPKLLILDNCFTMVDKIKKEKIMKYLKKYKQEENATIIYISSELNDLLFGEEIAILNESELIIETTNEILKQESIFKNNKIELPFMADLSNRLKYYGLVEKPIYDLDKMVNHLWK